MNDQTGIYARVKKVIGELLNAKKDCAECRERMEEHYEDFRGEDGHCMIGHNGPGKVRACELEKEAKNAWAGGFSGECSDCHVKDVQVRSAKYGDQKERCEACMKKWKDANPDPIKSNSQERLDYASRQLAKREDDVKQIESSLETARQTDPQDVKELEDAFAQAKKDVEDLKAEVAREKTGVSVARTAEERENALTAPTRDLVKDASLAMTKQTVVAMREHCKTCDQCMQAGDIRECCDVGAQIARPSYLNASATDPCEEPGCGHARNLHDGGLGPCTFDMDDSRCTCGRFVGKSEDPKRPLGNVDGIHAHGTAWNPRIPDIDRSKDTKRDLRMALDLSPIGQEEAPKKNATSQEAGDHFLRCNQCRTALSQGDDEAAEAGLCDEGKKLFHETPGNAIYACPECGADIEAGPFKWRDCKECGWKEGPQPQTLKKISENSADIPQSSLGFQQPTMTTTARAEDLNASDCSACGHSAQLHDAVDRGCTFKGCHCVEMKNAWAVDAGDRVHVRGSDRVGDVIEVSDDGLSCTVSYDGFHEHEDVKNLVLENALVKPPQLDYCQLCGMHPIQEFIPVTMRGDNNSIRWVCRGCAESSGATRLANSTSLCPECQTIMTVEPDTKILSCAKCGAAPVEVSPEEVALPGERADEGARKYGSGAIPA